MLILVSSFTFFTGCGSKKIIKNEVVSEDEPWYTHTVSDLAAKTKAASYDGFYFYEPAVVDGMIFVKYMAHYYNRETNTYESHEPFCIFDKNGDLLKEFEDKDVLEKGRILCVSDEDGTPVLVYISDGKLNKAVINKSTGDLESHRQLNTELGSGQISDCSAANGYIFLLLSRSGEYYLNIIKDEELVFEKKMATEFGQFSDVYPKDKGFTVEIEHKKYFYDPEKNEFNADGFVDIYNRNSISGEITGFDGRTYVKKADGIYVDDELYMSYANTDLNIYSFMQADLIKISEDYVALKMTTNKYGLATNSPVVYMLHKEDSNPNAGKSVISATSYSGEIDAMTGEAISRFNSINKDYFVKYVGSEIEYETEEEFEERYESDFIKRLSSENATDICFGTHELWWAQSDEYFIDLKEELSLDAKTYYTNITDSMSRDGKLYSMPLGFTAEGLWVEKDSVKDGAKGFSYDEYSDYVATVGNGKDEINSIYGKNEYFFECFSMMNDIWFNDGNVNISNEEFEGLCNYFSTHAINETALADQIDIYSLNINDPEYEVLETHAYEVDRRDPLFFPFTIGQYKDPVFLGFPTSDGRGAAALIDSSVSISASTNCKEGCIEFVKTLVSKDVQAYNDFNPINREALDAVLATASEQAENEYLRANWSSEAEAAENGYFHPNDAMRKAYKDALENVEVVTWLDGSIRAVVMEEMSSYFSGQKDIKSVENTLNDRLKTLYSEKYGK